VATMTLDGVEPSTEGQAYPPFVQQAQIAYMLGVSRQRVDQLTREKGFPDPAGRLPTGRIWSTDAIVRWAWSKGRSVKLPTMG
jgi:hypothetical protein